MKTIAVLSFLLVSFTLVSGGTLKSKRSQVTWFSKVKRWFRKSKNSPVDSTRVSNIAFLNNNNRCCCLKGFVDYYKVKRPSKAKKCSELCSSGMWFIKHKIKSANPKVIEFGLGVPGIHLINMRSVKYKQCENQQPRTHLYKVCKGRNCWKKDWKSIQTNYCCCKSCSYSQRAIKRRRGKNKGPCKADDLERGEVTGVESCETICEQFHCQRGIPLGKCKKVHSCDNGKALWGA